MDLLSCPRQIAELLSANTSWVNPSQDYLKAAKYLSDLGLIKMQERYYIICSYEKDHLDWPNVVNSNCDNKIFIDSDFDESCDDIICENCSRYILPNTYQKKRFHLLSVYLKPERFIDWFENQLSISNLMWQRVEKGVYHICSQGHIVSLIILNFCQI